MVVAEVSKWVLFLFLSFVNRAVLEIWGKGAGRRSWPLVCYAPWATAVTLAWTGAEGRMGAQEGNELHVGHTTARGKGTSQGTIQGTRSVPQPDPATHAGCLQPRACTRAWAHTASSWHAWCYCSASLLSESELTSPWEATFWKTLNRKCYQEPFPPLHLWILKLWSI